MQNFFVNQSPAFEVCDDGLARAIKFFVGANISHLFVLADPYIANQGIYHRLIRSADARFLITIYSEFSGEPKLASTQLALDAARACGADGVLGIGGGSALDMAKIVKTCLNTAHNVSYYVMEAHPLPQTTAPSVMIPTTAGTGSEASGTNILSLDNGRKGWVWGPETRPDLAILDPHFSVSMPKPLTAWVGMDAMVHAFEAATNNYTHQGAQLYAHQALRLCRTSLPLATSQPENLTARADMLLASYYAGRSIDIASTSIAHALSHALAALAPIHHGLATALSFEVSLPFIVEAGTDDIKNAASAFGVSALADLPEAVSCFMSELGIERILPESFKEAGLEDLMSILLSDEIQPMRKACVRWATEKDLLEFSKSLLIMAQV